MADPKLNGHRNESRAERIAHLVGGRLVGGAAIAFDPPRRIDIGGFRLRGLPRSLGGEDIVDIRASARPESDMGLVWLTRTSPGPLCCLGYVIWAHTPGARYHSYVSELPEETAALLCERATELWAKADRHGKVSAKRPLRLVRLGLIEFEGHRVDPTWERIGDAVALAFRDLDPEHIGTVTGLDGPAPRLYPAPTHRDWATELGRSERLVAAAAEAYRRRPGKPW